MADKAITELELPAIDKASQNPAIPPFKACVQMH